MKSMMIRVCPNKGSFASRPWHFTPGKQQDVSKNWDRVIKLGGPLLISLRKIMFDREKIWWRSSKFDRKRIDRDDLWQKVSSDNGTESVDRDAVSLITDTTICFATEVWKSLNDKTSILSQHHWWHCCHYIWHKHCTHEHMYTYTN